MSFSSETTHVARTSHRCCACNREIVPLARYVRWKGTTDGEFSSVAYHEVCRAAEVGLNDMLGTHYSDDWVGLQDYEHEDIPWLLSEHPDAAIYLGLPRGVIPTPAGTGGDGSHAAAADDGPGIPPNPSFSKAEGRTP